MKPNIPHLANSILLILLLSACNLPNRGSSTPDDGVVGTRVALTQVAVTQSAQQTPLASPTSQTVNQPTTTQTSTLTPILNPTNTTGPSPTRTPTLNPTNTTAPTNTPIPDPGTIAGGISGYPYGSLPALAIVAFGQEPPYYYSYLITGAGTTYYEMSSSYLIPGHFQVVAYDSSGHAGGCIGVVLVVSNTTVTCNITDWGGGYQAKPAGVPNP